MASVLSRHTVNVLILVIFGAFQTLLAVCPSGWFALQNACYIFLPDKMDWWQAKEVCERPGSSLIVPDSQEEHDFIWREIKGGEYGATDDMDGTEVWVGCSFVYDMFGRSLSCVNVTNPIYQNWAPGEPADLLEQCLVMADKFKGKWGSKSCSALKYVACEMHVSRVSFCMPTDADGQYPPHCLPNHEIKNLTTGLSECAKECGKEHRCHSFNLWQKEEEDVGVCQLNSATRLQASTEEYTYVEDCYFYEMGSN
ncbi:lactose-binding lectin l-2-like [Patiria miniata]|uniref:C-type lectin domain-containing protein n=1 Tax=Patiria miniata TaxID=46514 RepID=A0A914BGZ8_PATMI|nr:lactose-binding lectin l-2-like [Patiria miniata]